MKKRNYFTIALLIATLLSFQLAAFSPANASGATNLDIHAGRGFSNQGASLKVCNRAVEPIVELTFDVDSTNFDYFTFLVSPFDQLPHTLGSVDANTKTWTGQLDQDDCVSILMTGDETGTNGDTVTTTLSLTHSVQLDGTETVETYSNTLDDFVITNQADLKAEAHLITPGVISASSEVEYQVDVQNIGEGQYVADDFFIFAFTLPADATFVSVTDGNTGDILNASNQNCSSPGVLGTDIVLPGLEDFGGRHVVVCQLNVTGGTIPANSPIYPFKVKIEAGASLASGNADVVGILEGNDKDTMELFGVIARAENIVEHILTSPNNNIFHLDYNADDLQVTVNRCPGQGETTTTGTGCFRVSFNKLVYAPSFTASDIDLGGAGTVTGFEQLDDYTWEVQVSGITPNTTLTLLLGADSVQDYSAIMNNVQVLGENTIRYTTDAPTTTSGESGSAQSAGVKSASGSLAVTGNSDYNIYAAMYLIIAGLACVAFAKRKVKASVKA